MKRRCTLTDVEPLAGDVIRLTLSTPASFPFQAGQYLNVCHPDGTRIPFSIASPPERLPEIEIHFRPVASLPEATLMQSLLDPGRDIDVEGPHGDVWVDTLQAPLLIIAGGTGVAQANAILSHNGVTPSPAEKTLVWSISSPDARYFEPVYPGVSTFVAVDNEQPGALGWLAQTQPDLADYLIILCGPPDFVYVVTDALLAMGVSRDQLRADAFTYAPRR